MLNVVNASRDPFYNLALEEYLLKAEDFGDDLLIIWQNAPTIVVGRHQNAFCEVNHKYVQDNSINVVRRLSGGGAVYHDLGNINFTFIKRNIPLGKADISLLVEPVLRALHGLGVDASYSGRNDLMIDGRKFSGNAQYYYRDSILHHGTLLYQTDLTVLESCLSAGNSKYARVKSVQSRVTNLAEHLPAMSIEQLKKIIVDSVFACAGKHYREYALTEEERVEVEAVASLRYRNWDWNYGLPPRFNHKNEKVFPGGTITLFLDVDNHGYIRTCKIHGDFFAVNDIADLEKAFVGQLHDKENLLSVVQQVKPEEHYFINIADEDFVSCFF